MGSPREILADTVWAQLPRLLQERYTVTIAGDPFNLSVRAAFIPNNLSPAKEAGVVFPRETKLITTVENGRVVFAKIPDEFLSLLCVTE